MSCVTCEITPPPGHGGPMRLNSGHVGVCFGDGGLGWQITFNGRNVTLYTVEAHAGDMDTGWVELQLLNDDGAPRMIHPADEDRGIPRHVVTVIRRGMVQVIHGTHMLGAEQNDLSEVSWMPT